MDNLNIQTMLRKERLNTGFYVYLMINTKGKKIPLYLLDFLREMYQGSMFVFDVRAIFEQTPNKQYWRDQLGEGHNISDRDTLYQMVCTLNIDELSEKDFEKYCNLYIEDELLPYLVGCGFDLIYNWFSFQISPDYIGIAKEGNHSVIIQSKEMLNSLYVVLKDVFCLDDFKIEEIDGYFDMVGWCRIPNCISTDNIPKLTNLMKSINLKYEIE